MYSPGTGSAFPCSQNCQCLFIANIISNVPGLREPAAHKPLECFWMK